MITDNQNKVPLPITTMKKCERHPYFSLLSDKAKEIYKRKCKELISQKALSELYLDTLILYAQEYDKLMRIEAQLAIDGEFVKYKDRYGHERVGPHPLVKQRKDTMTNIIVISKKFGYSPTDVSKMTRPIESPRSKALDDFERDSGV